MYRQSIVLIKQRDPGGIKPVKDNIEVKNGAGILELEQDDLIKPLGAMHMQIVGTFIQMHRKDQAHQAQVVITMKVADEDAVYLMKRYLEAHHLHLHTLPAVNKEMPVLNGEVLSGGIATISRQRPAGTKDSKFETHEEMANTKNKKGWSCQPLKVILMS